MRLSSGQSVTLVLGLGIVVLVAIGLVFGSQFFYVWARVEQQEVGVQFESGRIVGIVGPGVYSDFGLYVNLQTISTEAISFQVQDEEIITKDKQRIGLVVAGDAFRPGPTQGDILRPNWEKYRNLYLSDEAARERVQALTQQAMKVCVGERTFDDAIIGTARDELRACIDDELSILANNYGLDIQNVVVPNVVLSQDVQAALDQIVASRLATEKAAQDKLKADAEADAEQARQEGEIRVEQSRIQEQAKQQTLLAKLDQERIIAQRAVIEAERANELAKVEAERAIIEAQKSNDLLAAEQDLAINRALALAAAEKAKAELAQQVALAELYARSPAYLQLQIALANASALKATDKIIFTPLGTTPTIVVPGPGVQPVLPVTPTPQ